MEYKHIQIPVISTIKIKTRHETFKKIQLFNF